MSPLNFMSIESLALLFIKFTTHNHQDGREFRSVFRDAMYILIRSKSRGKTASPVHLPSMPTRAPQHLKFAN